MIELFGRDDRARLGAAALLESARIPHRAATAIEPGTGVPLLVAGTGLDAGEIAAVRRRPALVLGGGARYVRDVLGAAVPEPVEGAYAIAVDEPLWPPAAVRHARAVGQPLLRVPLAPACLATATARGTTLATFAAAGGAAPLVVRHDAQVWSALDLGSAFANLLGERYLPAGGRDAAPSALAHAVYYAAPAWARRWAQRRLYARAERRRRGWAERASQYPVDATGWLLRGLFEGLLRLAFGELLRVAPWPAPFRSAATLTHDVEPTPFAYTDGLDRLLGGTATQRGACALGLVARPCGRLLSAERLARLGAYEVYCHGLTHRGDPVRGREQVGAALRTARRDLERTLGRRIRGYRSPRLDRSGDLAWALDGAGFEYDSSFPDVDRENLARFGGGVRWNLPYRPLIADPGEPLRFSRCLELPLTAPDCIQPLFAGDSPATLHAAIRAKADFVRRVGGVYVSLVHAGVFGAPDARLREQLRQFVLAELRHPDTWLATPAAIADWWRGREQLEVAREQADLRATNHGPRRLAGTCVVAERDGATARVALPPLEPGESRRVPIAA